MKIAHISDLHFGKIAHPDIVDALIGEVDHADIELITISGDLTQRARRREYLAAQEMLARIDRPVLVVPGNHDVYPWWRPISRIFRPLARYRAFMGDDLTPTFERDGLSVLGLNSAHGRTVKGGLIGDEVHEHVGTHFSSVSASVFKVLVLHHHLTQIQAIEGHDIARNAQKTLEVASDTGVDLILCGHLHVSHVEPFAMKPGGHHVVIASAGTATSSRGRDTNRDTNYYNVVTVGRDSFQVEERKFDLTTRRFVSEAVREFERNKA